MDVGAAEFACVAGLDGPELRLARAALYARDPARLRPIRSLEMDTDYWPDADQMQLMAGLIEVYDGIGDEASVIRLYRRIVGRRANELAVWEALFRRANRAGDLDTVSAARAAILRIAGASSPSAVPPTHHQLNCDRDVLLNRITFTESDGTRRGLGDCRPVDHNNSKYFEELSWRQSARQREHDCS